MSDTPDVFVIGTIKMLAQLGQTEKIVELCNEWLDKFEAAQQPRALDAAAPYACDCDGENGLHTPDCNSWITPRQ